ncbi:zinc finger HIT domain-containing protein 1-like [Limulus polyphemus]|uniref:Zinc finger HIT domain-containing protein 1-like n=1 Tax=Limulus polyphemus TaxID=6850 RepID=A0ABM1TMN5_LIMPO|nr:zinc finger HIT domain-containing protein 1-like [Limulus polyphemus]XP_022257143.1 zinc finger HIT domain-containing protein 1-like [Limulus polyphemus]XP_022257144.1 zinc finger HIT domain-containing protein 1-like [Limulus polyphemus]
MGDKRESSRVKEVNQQRVLDKAARKRRQRKALDALEQDNFHDDPHANLVMHKKAPKFEETLESKKRNRRLKSEPFKQRFRKNFTVLLEEEQLNSSDPPNYLSACVPPSKFPEHHFCSVCGFPSNYTCIPCGARYCCVKCLGTHRDTRCLKWTA